MTPKEKAIELVTKFDVKYYYKFTKGQFPVSMHNSVIKECALIAANEMLNDIPFINNTDQEASKRVFWIYTIEEIKKL
jgi:hypothetical protein